MISRLLALAVLLALPPAALVQNLAPAPPAPPGGAVPVTLTRVPVLPKGVAATLRAPRSVTGALPVTLTLSSELATPLTLGAGRDNRQHCAFAPSVRVLRVGTREVVYPASGAARLCTQELLTKTLPAGGRAEFTRDLDLPPGEYMVEGWFSGFADDVRVKVPAQPVRVTVR